MLDPDNVVRSILHTYTSLCYSPPHNHYTILAAFFLSSPDLSTYKIISLATGTKSLPTVRFPERGEALHDSHAEIVARRAALRWFLEEIARCHDYQQSQWICWSPNHGRYSLRPDVQLSLYVSTLPCGDASTRYLAAMQDEEMARLKDSSPLPVPVGPNLPALPLNVEWGTTSRGRDGYSLLGVLRTKPGRADSPPTICMSCSDKIASWNVHGIQGALGSLVLKPLYISVVVVGEVGGVDSDGHHLRQIIQEDCERALWGRVADVKDLPDGYVVHKPTIHFTGLPFLHSRMEMAKIASSTSSTNESLCWIADRVKYEILINGLKRGVSPKHRFRDQSRPVVCKYSMYQLVSETLARLAHTLSIRSLTYRECKRTAEQYQEAKEALRRQGSPFSGWIQSGAPWESFYLNDRLNNV